jgi:hypothetical protein
MEVERSPALADATRRAGGWLKLSSIPILKKSYLTGARESWEALPNGKRVGGQSVIPAAGRVQKVY